MTPCVYGCRKRVAYKGNACKDCANAHGLASGDITGRVKAANDESSARPPRGDAAQAKKLLWWYSLVQRALS